MSDVGVYKITLTATLNDESGKEDTQNEWTLTLLDPCLSTEINSNQLTGFVLLQKMVATVKSASPATQSFSTIQDTKSELYG